MASPRRIKRKAPSGRFWPRPSGLSTKTRTQSGRVGGRARARRPARAAPGSPADSPAGATRCPDPPPGSRSLTNRALVTAALASGDSVLVGATESDDAAAMREGLRALGVSIRTEGERWSVAGCGGRPPARGALALDVRASGTTARFLTAVAALTAAGVEVTLDGSARMRERPIGDLVAALCALGADAQALGPRGCPPVRVRGGGLAGGRITIDARRSSQYVSAVLLAAPAAAHDVEIALVEGRLVSRPFVDLTLQVMSDFGADARWTEAGGLVVRSGRPYVGRRYAIEPDAQAAVYAFAAAAIAGGRVVVEGIPPGSRQPDLRVLDALAAMGCRVERSADTIELAATAGTLRGCASTATRCRTRCSRSRWWRSSPRDRPRSATSRTCASRRPTGSLRSRREIRRLGGRAEAGPDWIRIEPAPLHGAAIETYADHRMAMSFALAGLAVEGVAIRDPGCVAKTWPGFFAALEAW